MIVKKKQLAPLCQPITKHINLYLPWAAFIAQVLGGPSKQLKQILIQTEHSIVKNPNWPEVNLLAIYKRGLGFERINSSI